MTASGFTQSAPQLANQYHDDRMIQMAVRRTVPPELVPQAERELVQLGELAAGELYLQQLRDRKLEPEHQAWDAWGNRVDTIKLTPLWRKAHTIAAQFGLVATAYEGEFQPVARIVQFAKVYLFHASTDTFCCPLAMTDGAAATLLRSAPKNIVARAVSHLTSRDPEKFWTSGQWMTETSGGSDVGGSETVAQRQEGGHWTLTGRKWFASACTSEVALALARPEGASRGSKGLALFYLETRPQGDLAPQLRITRLKDKLGTRQLPTAELMLDAVPAVLIGDLTGGVKTIAPMLNITRTWNSVCATALLRRAVALARDYANRRVSFGRPLAEQPLHLYTLAGVQSRLEGAFCLTFFLIERLGASEQPKADDVEYSLVRVLAPMAKALTAKYAVAGISEMLEAFGGAGYMEDTGLARLLRDAQVLPIWEGTTNVLALDFIRTLQAEPNALALYKKTVETRAQSSADSRLAEPRETVRWLMDRLLADFGCLNEHDCHELTQAYARRVMMTCSECLALALLIEQAERSLARGNDVRPVFAARRYAREISDAWPEPDLQEDGVLATDIFV